MLDLSLTLEKLKNDFLGGEGSEENWESDLKSGTKKSKCLTAKVW